jgi:hypothetical protein
MSSTRKTKMETLGRSDQNGYAGFKRHVLQPDPTTSRRLAASSLFPSCRLRHQRWTGPVAELESRDFGTRGSLYAAIQGGPQFKHTPSTRADPPVDDRVIGDAASPSLMSDPPWEHATPQQAPPHEFREESETTPTKGFAMQTHRNKEATILNQYRLDCLAFAAHFQLMTG